MPVDFNATALKAGIDAFGETIKYIPVNAAPFTVSGVFDSAYMETNYSDGVPITQTMPVLGIKLDTFTTQPAQNDHLVARGKVYVVREVRYDSHGGAKLMLNYDDDFEYPQ